MYLFNKKRKKFYLRLTYGEMSFYLFCVAMCFVNFKVTLLIFIIPFLFARVVMMLGNWAQHAFVDPNDPLENTINCINTKYNDKCWNDGYHISHHIKPNLHWTLHPEHLLTNMHEYAENKAFVFEGIHFLHVWWYLMTNNYETLAKRVVNINGMFKSEAEVIALMKARTRKIER